MATGASNFSPGKASTAASLRGCGCDGSANDVLGSRLNPAARIPCATSIPIKPRKPRLHHLPPRHPVDITLKLRAVFLTRTLANSNEVYAVEAFPQGLLANS